MATMNDDFALHAAHRQDSLHPEAVAKNGKAEDITRMTRQLDIHTKDMATFGSIVATVAANRKEPWRLHAYLQALASRLPDTGKERDDIIHAKMATQMAALLTAAPSSDTRDAMLACVPEHLRQITLDRMLRVAANQGYAHCIPVLVVGGANPQADQSRCLLNALLREKTECAAALRSYGAQTDQALTLSASMNLGKDTREKISGQLIQLALLTQEAADFYYGATLDAPDGFKGRIPLCEAAVTLFRQNKPEALQQFLRGYLSYKREFERQRKSDEGYARLVVTPIAALMAEADHPETCLSHILTAMPPRDRETATGLILRHACTKGHSPLVVDAIIANGATVGMHGNLALSLAVRNGHTELALHLARTHGASIGEAVLDAQINGVEGAQMQKLYSFMAAQMTQTVAAPPLRLHKSASPPPKP